MFSIADELQRLSPIEIPKDEVNPADAAVVDVWVAMERSLSRLGKQVLRVNQNFEYQVEAQQTLVGQLKSAIETVQTQNDEYRRELSRAREDSRATRLAALTIIDALDDLSVIARQRSDTQWSERVGRLTERALECFLTMGMSEIPSLGRVFDESVHEALGTLDRSPGQEAGAVVDVVRRGFRHGDVVLRRAQVITTR